MYKMQYYLRFQASTGVLEHVPPGRRGDDCISHSVLDLYLPKQSKRGLFVVSRKASAMNFSLKYSLPEFPGSAEFHIMLREKLT